MKQQRLWLLFIVAIFGVAFAPLPLGTAVPTSRTVRLEASSFEFSPAVVAVNPGDQVTIELAATDVMHGLYLDGYDLEITAEPGQTAVLTFTADKTGTFRFRCSVTCGALHPFMIGKLKVGPNLLLWRSVALSLLAVLFFISREPLFVNREPLSVVRKPNAEYEIRNTEHGIRNTEHP